MQLGFIGLGRMGSNMVLHLLENGYHPIIYDLNPEPVRLLGKEGAIPSSSLEHLMEQVPLPRTLWLMVPAKNVDETISGLQPYLQRDDILIDGGNSWYQDSQRRYASLKENGIHFLDCGTSGGMEGARHGACMMIGGDKETYEKAEKLFHDLCVPQGYAYMGKSGSGHFTKMIHNTIEYGMMGAIAEGMQALQESHIDPQEAVRVYAHGSIIESRLVSWLQQAYEKGLVDEVQGVVPRGETEGEMRKLEGKYDLPVLTAAERMRVATRGKPSYAGKVLAAMRNMFGGHAVKKR